MFNLLDMLKTVKGVDRLDRKRSKQERGKSGNKLAKKMRKGAVGLSYVGSVYTQAIREMARDKWLAKKANK